MRGASTYARLRSRHARLWLQLARTEQEIVQLIARASGTEIGAHAAQSESHAISDRIAAWFPLTLREAIDDAIDAEKDQGVE